ncbi:HD domain-containing protein [Iodobacter sp. HSC-16F04]|uniref:HD domain-containing protein n=1 Tax=Iodobacter violaceini TaxID=3044271 RepID=A0ABX0KTI4_9NEIS|nr:HD family phosphohydrolase [Iodobacter violacea]NHQ85777.1 HD domain-containing protein [Iodobacter violacea]
MLSHDILHDRLEQLNAIGISLSCENHIDKLMETILIAAKHLVNADAGTLYLVKEGALYFEIVITESLGIAMGGTTGHPTNLPPVMLRHTDGTPNLNNVVACAVNKDITINIEDAYTAEGYDFSGTKRFDASVGYRSKSFLTVPMKNHEREIIGVLQLINAKDEHGELSYFDQDSQSMAESLASQAAIALTNRRLIHQLEELFESFINLINLAIDDKSPYTGGHCQRVPALTIMIAEAVNNANYGSMAGFTMDNRDRYELKIAGLLHDCGKITTPVHVVDKATKLQTIFDRIHLIDARFEVLKRDAEIDFLRGKCTETEWKTRLAQIESDRTFLRHANTGGEFMPDSACDRVKAIAQQSWLSPDGVISPFLSAEEIENLSIAKGTLTTAERQIINHHIEVTIEMLESLPWPKHLKNVAEFAGGHHERMDGKGYPRGLTKNQMSIQARIMGIADVFEALTARDRPYKDGMKISQSLTILARMAKDQHIDGDLFEIFVKEKVWKNYAELFLGPSQIDEVDEEKLLRIARGLD